MQNFDPYYEWLGIRPEEQPPNYYRLLGLTIFESSQAAIQNAADRQVAYLRTLAVGPRGPVAQQLLNYVAQAAGMLLDPRRKSEYDAWLGGFDDIEPDPLCDPAERIVLPAIVPVGVAIPPPPAPPVAEPVNPYAAPAVRIRGRRKRQSPIVTMAQTALATVAGSLLAAGILWAVVGIDPVEVANNVQTFIHSLTD